MRVPLGAVGIAWRHRKAVEIGPWWARAVRATRSGWQPMGSRTPAQSPGVGADGDARGQPGRRADATRAGPQNPPPTKIWPPFGGTRVLLYMDVDDLARPARSRHGIVRPSTTDSNLTVTGEVPTWAHFHRGGARAPRVAALTKAVL